VRSGRAAENSSPLVSRSWNSRSIPPPNLWATPGLQRYHFTIKFFFGDIAHETKFICGLESRHDIVGVVTRSRAERTGSHIPNQAGAKILIFFKLSICGLRSAKRPCQVLPVPLSPVIKRLGCESDHAPQYVADFRMCVVNLKFPVCRQGRCTIQYSHKFTVSHIYFRIVDKY